LKGNPSGATAAVTDFTIQGLPNKITPDPANDKLLLFDSAAGVLKYCTVGQCSSAGSGGVSSLNGLTGALSLVAGSGITITPAGSNITIASSGTGNPCTGLALTGDVTSTNCVTTLATVNGTTGTFGSATSVPVVTVNAKGLITTVVNTAISLPFSGLTGSLACTQMPALTGDVTLSAGTCATTIPVNSIADAKLAQIGGATIKGNPTASTANVTGFTIQGLTNKPTPDTANDRLLLYDNSTGTLKNCSPSQCVTGVSGLTSINSQTGPAITLSAGTGITITNPSGNTIQIASQTVPQPTTKVFTTGTNQTYTVPAGATRIEVTLVGGGGGGAGGGTTGAGDGGNGGATCLRTTSPACTSPLYQAGGGGGGTFAGNPGAAGVTTGACTDSIGGGVGGGETAGGNQGAGPLGGSGTRGGAGSTIWQGAAVGPSPNTGAGGGGGTATAAGSVAGPGGGSGSTCWVVINSPAASYVYTVGAGGVVGTAGTGGLAGGPGAVGIIIIREYYGIGVGASNYVSSVNGQTGNITVNAGAGISVTQSGNVLTLTNTLASAAAWSTGDVKVTMKNVADPGWVMMDDGTIGDATSGGSNRANADTHDLFILLWTNCSDSWCSVSPEPRGASAVADWNAHKTIGLPWVLGRHLAAAGTPGAGYGASVPRALGELAGTESASVQVNSTGSGSGTVTGVANGTHTLTISEMPVHQHGTHIAAAPWQGMSFDPGGSSNNLNTSGSGSFTYGVGTDFTGGGQAFAMSSNFSTPFTDSVSVSGSVNVPTLSPATYFWIMIKL
jgi:hypothetical protein